jgi:glycosyltransferase involved in cell wall biosynthesis
MDIRTTIIVPAYHEEKGIAVVLDKILKVIDDSYEIVVVDDGSEDKTFDIAHQYKCRIIQHEVNKGKGQAIRTGIEQAKGEKIIWIDADDSYPSSVIPLISNALDWVDVVVCSRAYGKKYIPKINRVGLAIFRLAIKNIYGFKANDPCSGLYAVRKEHLLKMNLTSSRFTIEPEISIKTGRMKLRTIDIPIEYQMRLGISKLGTFNVGWQDSICIIKHLFWRVSD